MQNPPEDDTSADQGKHSEPYVVDYEAGEDTPVRRRRRFRFWPSRRAHLITDARRTPAQNRQHRERVYAILQGSRVPFLLLSALTYMVWHEIYVSALLFLVSVPLPWIAVVLANGRGEPRDERMPQVYKPAAERARREAAQQRHLRASGSASLPSSPHDPQNGATGHTAPASTQVRRFDP